MPKLQKTSIVVSLEAVTQKTMYKPVDLLFSDSDQKSMNIVSTAVQGFYAYVFKNRYEIVKRK